MGLGFSDLQFFKRSLKLRFWCHFSLVAQSCLTLCYPWTTANQASLSITNSWSLLRLVSTELLLPSDHLIFCRALLLPPSIFPSIRVFSNELALCMKWTKYWGFFSFSISPSSEYSGLISSRIDWLDLLAVQGILKSLLQHHSSKPTSHDSHSSRLNPEWGWKAV